MKSPFAAVIVIFFIFTSCGQQQQVKARIFERKELKGNRLMIRYQYAVDEKVYVDSATVGNVIINTDSIPIIIDPANPEKSVPDIR
jgi:hypothetical protein